MRAVRQWFVPTVQGFDPFSERVRAPLEVIVMRFFGTAWLLTFVLGTAFTKPRPALEGRGLGILVAMVVLLVLALSALLALSAIVRYVELRGSPPEHVALLAAMVAASAALAVLQPNGPWEDGPVLVGILAALRLERGPGAWMLAFSLAILAPLAVVKVSLGTALGLIFTDVPWFLVMRLLRELTRQRHDLNLSRASEARAATEAERARLAREMHDVLAHSLSALALQLESTRMLAANHEVAPELTRAIDQAHQLAASGLQEARQAIATARGDERPGPDRIGLLADAFGQQSGLPIALAVRGTPRPLPPDAQLAVFRTAQEALTNVRRHAAADRVEIELSYLPKSTVLVIEDRGAPGTPAPAPLSVAGTGYGLTGMRERAELLGGELLAEPTDAGFRVELRIPA
jgi:signal transduction histidine kinase